MPITNPLLLDIPEQFETERLLLRAPRRGDGKIINPSIVESHESLRQWMPWAKNIASVEENEEFALRSLARFILREELNYVVFERASGEHAGMTGFHHIDWSVPCFEMGYWLRTRFEGQGYMTEAVNALTRFAFDTLQAERIEIRCDVQNSRSAAVAQRAGYILEGTFRHDARDVQGELRTTLIFARIRG